MSCALQLALDDVSPIPKLARKTRLTRGRKGQHSTVPTASPQRKILAEKLVEKEAKGNDKGQLKKRDPPRKKIQKTRKERRKHKKTIRVRDYTTDESESEGKKSTDDDSNNDDEESYKCTLCFHRGIAKMMPVKCKVCKNLAHPDCADIKDEGFVCNFCVADSRH